MPEFAKGGAAYIGRGRHLEYNESCLNVRNICIGLWWHNTLVPYQDAESWAIVQAFAGDSISLPETESCLQILLGNCFIYMDWKPMFNEIFASEDDIPTAVTAIEIICAGIINAQP